MQRGVLYWCATTSFSVAQLQLELNDLSRSSIFNPKMISADGMITALNIEYTNSCVNSCSWFSDLPRNIPFLHVELAQQIFSLAPNYYTWIHSSCVKHTQRVLGGTESSVSFISSIMSTRSQKCNALQFYLPIARCTKSSFAEALSLVPKVQFQVSRSVLKVSNQGSRLVGLSTCWDAYVMYVFRKW